MMTRRRSFLAYAALLVGMITFASSFARPSAGQRAEPQPVGRYQIAVGSSSGSVAYVIDTATGRIWNGVNVNGQIKWRDLSSPPFPK